MNRDLTHEYSLRGWPAGAFIVLAMLGIADVIERMVEVVF